MSIGGPDAEIEEITVRLPAQVLERIDESWREQGYANRSEFVRDALQKAAREE